MKTSRWITLFTLITTLLVVPTLWGTAVETRAAEDETLEKHAQPDGEYVESDSEYVESDSEKKIYSYLQVPEEFSKDPVWSGDWSSIEAGGQEFFYFGCGICCLSNMYSTCKEEPRTPDLFFYDARDNTDYNPDSGVGALTWYQLKELTKSFASEVKVKKKPSDYSKFQQDIEKADTAVVLVCKDNDDKLWWYTKGHYVNIWEYDPETDTVFVTDSSGLFNRTRVNLQDIYNALKTASDAQYMTVIF